MGTTVTPTEVEGSVEIDSSTSLRFARNDDPANYVLQTTTLLGGFVFVLIFFLAKGSKLGQNGLLYGVLWFLGFSVVSEVGFWLAFKYSPIMMIAGITSGLCHLINGIIVGRLSK